MKKISTTKIKRLSVHEFQQFIKSSQVLFTNHGALVPRIQDSLDKLTDVTATLGQGFQTKTKHVLTPELEALEERRIKALMAIKKSIESHVYDEREDWSLAAKALLENYDFNIGNYGKKSLPKKTGTIESLLKDFESMPDLVGAVSKLGLEERIKNLSVLNTEYFTKYLERIKSRRQIKFNAEVRKQMLNRFEALLLDTEAHVRLSADPGYIALLDDIEGLYLKFTTTQNPREKQKNTSPPPDIRDAEEVVEIMGSDSF